MLKLLFFLPLALVALVLYCCIRSASRAERNIEEYERGKTMKVDLSEYEVNLIKIALSNWHCVLSIEAIKRGESGLHEAATDVYNIMKKIEGR